MPTCGQCNGEGYVDSPDEMLRGQPIRDACYHCSTTGQISEEHLFGDKLKSVATTLAVLRVNGIRSAPPPTDDEDYEPYDWDLAAAENGLSSYDYFRVRVWDEEARILSELGTVPLVMQQALVAWNEVEVC